jgi:hypothetical protein
MTQSTTSLVERLTRKAFRREERDGRDYITDVPCDADDDGAEEYFVNPDGPEAATTIAELVAALTQTQWMLETIDRTNSTNFSEVRERILANRPLLTKSRSAL